MQGYCKSLVKLSKNNLFEIKTATLEKASLACQLLSILTTALFEPHEMELKAVI